MSRIGASDEPRWHDHSRTGLAWLPWIGVHRTRARTTIPEHRLPHHQLALVETGACSLRVDGARLDLAGGQGAWLPTGAVLADGPGRTRGLFWWIGIAPELMPEGAALAALASPGPRTFTVSAELLRAAERTFLLVDGRHPNALLRSGAAATLLGLVLETLRTPATAPPADDLLIAPALALVAQLTSGDLSPTELAKACGLGRSAFAERFRLATGRTPRDYVNERRVALAQEQLAAGRPVAVVARMLAFSSAEYLAAVMRRHTGRPPSAFRRQR